MGAQHESLRAMRIVVSSRYGNDFENESDRTGWSGVPLGTWILVFSVKTSGRIATNESICVISAETSMLQSHGLRCGRDRELLRERRLRPL